MYSATVGVISGISGVLMAPLLSTIYWLVATNSNAQLKVTLAYVKHALYHHYMHQYTPV
jgi:hypothetical protein